MCIILKTILIFLLVINVSGQMLYTTSAGGVGAVYTMTNGAMMNKVIIYRLTNTGQLVWVDTVNTNGTGVNTTNMDPLYSQGSMAIYSTCLFVVNAGSNSVSMFTVNSMDATQLKLAAVQPTNGWFPISIAVSAKYACVLTGGTQAGIRCFTFNSSGLYVVPSFDRNLTSYISQSTPPSGPAGTFSEILFSPDGLSLIISFKGYNETSRGYLLFYQLTNGGTILSSNPTLQTPSNGISPFSMTLVGTNGLLVTDSGAGGVLTQTYSSATGTITNSILTPVNTSIAGPLCRSTYSPMIGNYYVIGASAGVIAELNINLSSMSTPVKIIGYYLLPNNTGALDTIVVSLAGMDYLFVIGTTAQVINSYRLNAPGNASFNQIAPVQQSTANVPKIAGIVAYVQTRSSSAPGFFYGTSILFWPIAISFYFYYVYENN